MVGWRDLQLGDDWGIGIGQGRAWWWVVFGILFAGMSRVQRSQRSTPYLDG